MTGLAQVQYMQNEAAMLDATTLDEVYLNEILPRKLELDLQYIQNQSFLLDLKLLTQTLFIILIKRSGGDN